MDKQPKQTQFEFFANTQEHREAGKRDFADCLRINLHPEQTIIGIVFIVLVFIFSFSLGVERGKALSAHMPRIIEVHEDQLIAEPTPQSPPAEIVTTANESAIPGQPAAVEIGKYTIQVASFKTGTYAEKEADQLKKSGHETVLLSKGKHVIVCVGNFTTKQDAQRYLGKLKNKYNDCYIRRL